MGNTHIQEHIFMGDTVAHIDKSDLMRKLWFITIGLLAISCTSKTDKKEFTDGKMVVQSYTLVESQIQSSDPNKSLILAGTGDLEEILRYDSYGVNNINVIFNKKKIIITAEDLQTQGLLKNAAILKKTIDGYEISVDLSR